VVGLENRIIQYNNDIYNIKPMLRFNEIESKKKYLQEISSRPLRVLFVGRIEEAKGITELIDASRIMKDFGLSYDMRLVGVGSLYDNVNDQLKYNNAPNISLIGLVTNKNDMIEQYEWADVLVLPSHHEGFPRVLLEAMLKSCVVITTMVGGIPTVMNDGSNCLSIPLRDATAIANTLGRLPSDLEKMQEIADAGRETVLDILRTRQSHADTLCEALESRFL
jgi:glycosyltransferase involved in cell wall biosynthesis